MAGKTKANRQERDMQLKISGLIDQLRGENSGDNKEDAGTQLLAIGSPALPALLAAVRSETGNARLEIAKMLKRLADTSSAETLLELLSDDDFDIRWEAIEGLSAIGYDSLKPLISAIIQNPGSMKLRNASHHILHHVAAEGYYSLLKPLMMAIEGDIPNVEIPAAARKIQSEFAR